MLGRARRMFVRLSRFEQIVADAAADKILRDLESPEKQRMAAQERERKALIDEGVPSKDAADLARSGGGRAPWLMRGNRRRRAKRTGSWF